MFDDDYWEDYDRDLDEMYDLDLAYEKCLEMGHEWEDAGGDLLICSNCLSERWA